MSAGKTLVSARGAMAASSLGLSLLIVLVYGSGIGNKPVAEDFQSATEWLPFLLVDQDGRLGLVWSVALLALEALGGRHVENPAIYHLFSLGIHAAATLGLYWLAYLVGASRRWAFITAVVFAVYPRHHEPVFWPVGSSHAFMTAWILFSLAFYVRYRQGRGKGNMAVSAMLFALGVFTSEEGIAGIVMFFLYELLWSDDTPGLGLRTRLLVASANAWPFVVVVGIAGSISLAGRVMIGRDEATVYHVSLGLSQLKDLGGYLSYTMLPFVPLREPTTLIKMGMLAVTCGVLGASIRWGTPLMRFGATWMIAASLPYAALVPFGNADRYFYFPAVGFALLVGCGLHSLHNFAVLRLRQREMRLTMSAATCAVAAYALLAVQAVQDRSREWREAGDLIESTLTQIYTMHPTVDQNSVFYFLDLPVRYKQVMFLGTGIRSAMATHYKRPDLLVYQSNHPDLLATAENTLQGVQGTPGVRVYVYHQGVLVDRSPRFADPVAHSLLVRHSTMQ